MTDFFRRVRNAVLMVFSPPKPPPDILRDTVRLGVVVLLDNHTVSETEWLRGYLNGPARGRQLKVSQIDYVRGFVTRVVLATHPGWNCNCHECQEKRGRDGLATQY